MTYVSSNASFSFHFFEIWKRSLTVWMFLISFPYRHSGTKPLPWFVFSISDLVSFLFSSLILHLRKGHTVVSKRHGKKVKPNRRFKKNFLFFCPVSIVFCRVIRISLIYGAFVSKASFIAIRHIQWQPPFSFKENCTGLRLWWPFEGYVTNKAVPVVVFSQTSTVVSFQDGFSKTKCHWNPVML